MRVRSSHFTCRPVDYTHGELSRGPPSQPARGSTVSNGLAVLVDKDHKVTRKENTAEPPAKKKQTSIFH